MPRQPLVLRAHFYLPGGSGGRALRSAAHHVGYIGSRRKHELLQDADEQAIAREAVSTLEGAAHHVGYTAHEGTMGYMGPLAADPGEAERQILASQGPVWRFIVSVGEADALAMGGDLTTRAGWDKALTALVPETARAMGLDPDRVRWIAAAHRWQARGGRNPHVHLLTWQVGEPIRARGKLSARELTAVKKAWAAELYRPEWARVGAAKTAARADARVIVLADVRAARAARHPGHQRFHRELADRLAGLARELPGRGRLAYAYMPPPVKTAVADTIRWLWAADPALQAAHDRFVTAARDLASAYWADEARTGDPARRARELARVTAAAEQDLIERLAGALLQAARDAGLAAGREAEREAYREASGSAWAVLRDDRQRERLQPWVERIAREGPTDEALIALVREARTWPERAGWLARRQAEHAETDKPEPEGRAWDTVVQTVVQAAARRQRREAVQAAWQAAMAEPDTRARLRDIATDYAASGRTRDDRRAALAAIRQALPGVTAAGAGEADRRFSRWLGAAVAWRDERAAVQAAATPAVLRQWRRDPAAAARAVIQASPELAAAWRTAGYSVRLPPAPVTTRIARETAGGWQITERTSTGPPATPLRATLATTPPGPATSFSIVWPPIQPPPGLPATVWDRGAHAKTVEAARAGLTERVVRHLDGLAAARGLRRGVGLGAMMAGLTWRAERDSRLTQRWLTESRWRRRAAEIAMARNTGQQVAL